MPPRKRASSGRSPIDSIRHKDKRVNIPTEELRDFVKEEENRPKTVLYPRDPSLDPQLVWKGKDEQDSKDLAIPVVPVYIQEKIHPQALIEDLRREAEKTQAGKAPAQTSLFGDFNGIEDFSKKVDFYHHEGRWTNRMILGDSLLVMTSLAEKEGLKGKVQAIYFDPPYGIKFGSNWQVSTRKRDVKDGKVEDAVRQPEQVKAFRDTWQLGIHSYLAYMRDRLTAARELLTETGSVFVQIGDANVHLARSLLDEVYGSENFIGCIAFKKTSGTGAELIEGICDYILWYCRDRESVKYRPIFLEKEPGGLGSEAYRWVETPDGKRGPSNSEESNARFLRPSPLTSDRPAQGNDLREYSYHGRTFTPGRGTFKTDRNGLDRLSLANRLMASGERLQYVRFLDDFPAIPLNTLWADTQSGSGMEKIYVVQTNEKVTLRCLLMATDPGDLVLDPTCGSGTTAYVAEQWGRRWITIDTSRVALALARTRIMAARYPYYLLSDSQEGIRKEAEITGQAPLDYKTDSDIRKGFVYKRVPHITLKSIANNEEIDVIHAKYQPKQDATRERLNKTLKEKAPEWEIPCEANDSWSKEAKTAHAEFWKLKRERQKEIDASIAKRADTEALFDQPYEDGKRIRVSGPFTVESLSPHRVLETEADRTRSEIEGTRDPKAASFETMILENLKAAGVQNTRKAERLVFSRLDPFPGAYIQAAGEFAGPDGKPRRVAVSIGPEHGTVGPAHVKEAAKEALKGAGFDLLIVLGFAFDARADETAKEFSPALSKKQTTSAFAVADGTQQYGKLAVLLARMNPDLSMGQDLLKKTGAANLFMVFGEPDVDVRRLKNGKIEVEVKGLDVYDPTTGEVRSATTADIACWFVDTDYNGESFFVRHAYFTGEGEPFERLKKSLRADIDESAWSALYSTVSRPFDPPDSGKIAVKVINHYGDEVMKIYTIQEARGSR